MVPIEVYVVFNLVNVEQGMIVKEDYDDFVSVFEINIFNYFEKIYFGRVCKEIEKNL